MIRLSALPWEVFRPARRTSPPRSTDGFYSGNTDPLAAIDEATYGDEYREDYYAWTWGDALFVVIDPFQYTMNLPYTPAAGEGSDDPVTGDQWSWTLGAQQFNWFKQTLENSNAKYKFVFSHQMVGGIPRAISRELARVTCAAAPRQRHILSGEEKTQTARRDLPAHRNAADFGTTPIHQLMVENGVSAYFHGHDHQYVYETRDGIVYQEVPSPSMSGSGFSGIYTEGTMRTYKTIEMLPNSGHLRITVTPTRRPWIMSRLLAQPGRSITRTRLLPISPAPTHVLTTAVSPTGGGTINPAAGTHTYNEGDVVSVTATPNTGYTFSSWSGACSGSGACSVTMDADKTVTANFTAVPTYVLTTAVSPSGGGTISPAAGAHTYNQGAVVTVTATPNSGYTFSIGAAPAPALAPAR